MLENNTDYQNMVNGRLYDASNPELRKLAKKHRLLMEDYNRTSRYEEEKLQEILSQLFNKVGENVKIVSPVYIDYGANTTIGDNFYANYDCVLLDVAPIKIGNNVMFGPRVSLLTPEHPIDSHVRNNGLEFARPIVIEDGVWIGGNATILSGVTIGENSIVAAAAVVTKDVPANTIVAGSPAKIIREITEADSNYWKGKEAEYYQK